MSPSGKARDFDSRIRRFKSGHPSHCGGNHFLNTFKKELPFAMFLNNKREHLFLRQEIDALAFYNQELHFVMFLNLRNMPLQSRMAT